MSLKASRMALFDRSYTVVVVTMSASCNAQFPTFQPVIFRTHSAWS